MEVSDQFLRLVEGKGIDPDQLVMLITLGKRRGRLTKEEIIQVLPEIEFDDQFIDAFIKLLREARIEVSAVEEPDIKLAEFPGEGEAMEEMIRYDPAEDLIIDIGEIDNIIQIYMQEATHVPLLTAADEVELARRIELCRKAYEELGKQDANPERQAELQRIIEEGKKARERLIRANTRLVISVARRYVNRGLPLPDLIQEGNIGLMRAVNHFDYRRGFKFSTYATWWIRQAVTRALADHGRTIRLPAYISDQVSRLRKVQGDLQQQFGRLPTNEEIGDVMGLQPDRIEAMINSTVPPASLESPVGGDSEEDLGDILEDLNAQDPEEAVSDRMDWESLRGLLNQLPPREREIIKMRYGLDYEEPFTLTQIGERLGITRERARQLEIQALNRLRHPEAIRNKKGKRKQQNH